jgi:O-antigen ligase
MSSVYPGTFLLLALVLGGGARLGVPVDIAMQLLAIPLLLAACWIAFDRRDSDPAPYRTIVAFCAGALLLAAVQLVLVWLAASPGPGVRFPDGLPGPEVATGVLRLAGHVTPHAAIAGLAGLLPPLAVLAGTLAVKPERRLRLATVVVVVGAVSLALGFAQILEGPDSPLRFHPATNRQEAVGFFANRNHFAALLYATLMFAAVRLVTAARGVQDTSASGRTFVWLTVAALFLIALVAGLAMSRSRAGVVLAIVAIALILLMALLDRDPLGRADRKARQGGMRKVVVATLSFAALFAAQFGLGGLVTRLQQDAVDPLRERFAATTFDLAWQTLPFGTGLGSFLPVYATAEKTADVFIGIANNAHNDLAELFLETGIVGPALLAAFAAWFLLRAFRIWLRPSPGMAPDVLLLQRAASGVILLLLLHSLVDYPLRTMALGCVAAFAIALLVDPLPAAEAEAPAATATSGIRQAEIPPAIVLSATPDAAPVADPQLDSAWQEAWRKEQERLAPQGEVVPHDRGVPGQSGRRDT